MDLFWLLMTAAALIGFAVGYTVVSVAALIEVRRMHREFEHWKQAHYWRDGDDANPRA